MTTAENLRNSDYVDAENERKGLYQNSEDEEMVYMAQQRQLEMNCMA